MQYFEVLSEANFLCTRMCKGIALLARVDGKRLCEKRYARNVIRIDRAALEYNLLMLVAVVHSIKAPLTS